MKRFVLRAFAIGTVISAAVFVVGFFWLRTSLPTIDGQVVVTGVESPVSIARSVYGVLTINASTHADTAFGLGYAHAQDRLWQMMSMRRFALGRISEVLGEITFDIDVRQRRLGFATLAQAQYAAVTPETRALLIAYANGVNAYLETRSGALPLPFVIARFTPERWEPWHGLLWGRLMAYQLTARWRQDIYRADALAQLGADSFSRIWPEFGDLPEMKVSGIEGVPSDYPVPFGASNAWVVAPSRSTTAGALLAGDPHLGLSLPGTWYLARLQYGDRWLEGATAPGAPFVILGRNNDVAWSVTSNEADVQDVVAVDFADVDTQEETIVLRGGDVRSISIHRMGDAPVVGGALADNTGSGGFALLATALRRDDKTPDAFIGLNTAVTTGQAIAALRYFSAPFLNVHIADVDGKIARVHAGRLPARAGLNGRFPLPRGTLPWVAPLAHDVLPPVIDPSDGFVGNANERTIGLDAAPFPVVGDWPGSGRAQRLLDLSASWDQVGMAEMIAGQLDTRDITAGLWDDMLQKMTLSGTTADARDVLIAWDEHMDRDQAAPLIYAAWMAELRMTMYAETLGEMFGKLPLPDPSQVHTIITENVGVCADGACIQRATDSFVRAVAAIADAHGHDVADWRWGDVHQGRFDHQLLSRIPIIGPVFGRRIATDGGNRTLNRGAHRQRRDASDGFGFLHIHGAGFRAVHDLGGAPSRYALAIGQSGNPLSRHYDDLMQSWRDGVYIAFDGAAVATLHLHPQKR